MNKTFLALLIFSLLIGCTSRPILNLKNEPISNSISGKEKSLEYIGAAIMSSALKRGWTPRYVNPGKIEATLLIRGYRAEIEILYTQSDYSVNYLNSENLGYNGKNIHRNYNGWILKLSRTIQKEIYAK